MAKPLFSARNFLHDRFKNPPGVVAFVAAYRVTPPTLSATEKWFQRGVIPGDWLPVLLALIEVENGGPVSMAEYVEMGERHNDNRR